MRRQILRRPAIQLEDRRLRPSNHVSETFKHHLLVHPHHFGPGYHTLDQRVCVNNRRRLRLVDRPSHHRARRHHLKHHGCPNPRVPSRQRHKPRCNRHRDRRDRVCHDWQGAAVHWRRILECAIWRVDWCCCPAGCRSTSLKFNINTPNHFKFKHFM